MGRWLSGRRRQTVNLLVIPTLVRIQLFPGIERKNELILKKFSPVKVLLSSEFRKFFFLSFLKKKALKRKYKSIFRKFNKQRRNLSTLIKTYTFRVLNSFSIRKNPLNLPELTKLGVDRGLLDLQLVGNVRLFLEFKSLPVYYPQWCTDSNLYKSVQESI